MTNARADREAIADGVRQGYTEAQVSASVWKGRPHRFWRTREQEAGPTGAALERQLDRMARKYPGLVN